MPTERAPHDMTDNTTPSPFVASASSYIASPDFYPFHAFDGSILGSGTKTWVTDGVQTGWLKLDLGVGNAFVITNYDVVMNGDASFVANRSPKDWTLEGSHDGSAWDVIDTVTGQTAWTIGESRAFVCDVATTAYRYFRLNVSANNLDTYLQIGELYLQGEPAPVGIAHLLSGKFAGPFRGKLA